MISRVVNNNQPTRFQAKKSTQNFGRVIALNNMKEVTNSKEVESLADKVFQTIRNGKFKAVKDTSGDVLLKNKTHKVELSHNNSVITMLTHDGVKLKEDIVLHREVNEGSALDKAFGAILFKIGWGH